MLKTVSKSLIPCNRGSLIHLETMSSNLYFQEDKCTFHSRTVLRKQHSSPKLTQRSFSEELEEYSKVFLEEYLEIVVEEYLNSRLEKSGDSVRNVQLSCLSQDLKDFLFYLSIPNVIYESKYSPQYFKSCLSTSECLCHAIQSYSFLWTQIISSPLPNVLISTRERGRELTTRMYQ